MASSGFFCILSILAALTKPPLAERRGEEDSGSNSNLQCGRTPAREETDGEKSPIRSWAARALGKEIRVAH
jgi:hypothetical protein